MLKFVSMRWVVASSLGLALVGGCARPAEDKPVPATQEATVEGPASLKGKPAPDFNLETPDGKSVKLSDFKGNLVLLDFWATWCPPCVKGLPHVQELANDKELTEKGFRVVAINVKEEKAKVVEFMQTRGLTLPVGLDSEGKVNEAYKLEGIPTSILIARDGTVKSIIEGLPPPEELTSLVKDALK